MHSLVFEGSTWEEYEKLCKKDKVLHKGLRKILKQMLRDEDPSIHTYFAFGGYYGDK